MLNKKAICWAIVIMMGLVFIGCGENESTRGTFSKQEDTAKREEGTSIDLSTPANTIESFKAALESGDIESAGRCWPLFSIPREREKFEILVKEIDSNATYYYEHHTNEFSLTRDTKQLDQLVEWLHRDYPEIQKFRLPSDYYKNTNWGNKYERKFPYIIWNNVSFVWVEGKWIIFRVVRATKGR